MKSSFACFSSFFMVLTLSCLVTSCSEKKDKVVEKVKTERDLAEKKLAQDAEKTKRLEEELE